MQLMEAQLVAMRAEMDSLRRTMGQEVPPPPPLVSEPSSRNKAFNGIKVYGKEPEIYHGGEYAKYDLFTYQMEQVFALNIGLKDQPESEYLKVTFASTYLKGPAFNIWRTAFRVGFSEDFSWSDLKDLLAKHVRRAKFLREDVYSQ